MPLPSGTPLLLELRSKSDAGKIYGNLLGLYHLTIDTREESLRQGLVYRQLHDADAEEQIYLFRWESHCTLYTRCKYLTKCTLHISIAKSVAECNFWTHLRQILLLMTTN